MPEPESGLEFQTVIGKFIEKMGFEIDSTRLLDDGSVDFKAQTTNPMGGRITSLIRASTYSRLVNESDINDLYATMTSMGAVRAAYITTSGFSEDAVEDAKDKPISLINKYQLMDSIEKRGLITDKGLMEALDKFGMGEQHFQGYEQSFAVGKSDADVKAYFDSKAKKDVDKLMNVAVRYAPVTVLKVVTLKEVWTEDQTLRTVEKKDYMFVNLNNLELYYIMQKRKKSATENLLMRSDIIRKIDDLPAESKEHLLHLLDFGDLPIEDLQGKELSILKNKKVIDTYEGKRMKKGDFTEYAQMFLEGTLETVNMLITEIVGGISGMGDDTGKKAAPEEKPKKKVMAVVNMPHVFGGIYDIWKYIDAMKGLRHDSEIDPLVYNSKGVSNLLKSLMKGKVKSEGLIFMPYFKAKYVDPKNKVTKYEVLIAPKFKDEHLKKEDPKMSPKIKRKPVAGEFKLIK